jgi:hypothetical protein
MHNRHPDQITFENIRDVEGIAFPNAETGQLDLSYTKMSVCVAPGTRIMVFYTTLLANYSCKNGVVG